MNGKRQRAWEGRHKRIRDDLLHPEQLHSLDTFHSLNSKRLRLSNQSQDEEAQTLVPASGSTTIRSFGPAQISKGLEGQDAQAQIAFGPLASLPQYTGPVAHCDPSLDSFVAPLVPLMGAEAPSGVQNVEPVPGHWLLAPSTASCTAGGVVHW